MAIIFTPMCNLIKLTDLNSLEDYHSFTAALKIIFMEIQAKKTTVLFFQKRINRIVILKKEEKRIV